MTDKFMLDACALIAYLNDEQGAEKVEELLWQCDQHSRVVYIHTVNLLEIYYGVYRDEGEKLAQETCDKVINLPIKISWEAGRLGRRNGKLEFST